MTSGWLQRRRGRNGRLYGRGREMALLRELLSPAVDSDGALALISGEAGIGKTALVDALALRAGQRRFEVLRGDCFDLTTTPPYGPWIEALRGYDPAVSGVPAPEWFGVAEKSEDIGSQAAVLEDANRFFSELAEQRPLLIVLEDLHWSDPASLDALRFLARRLIGRRVLIVGTFRDEEITRGHRLFELLPALVRESNSMRVSLSALDEGALREMATERYDLDGDDLSRLTAHLARLSEGNPLYATELLNGIEDAGVMRRGGNRHRLGRLHNVAVPPLIQQVIERRMAGLADRERRLLEVGAVIGHEFSVDLWAAVADEPEAGIIEAVEHADALDVLRPDGRIDRVRFRHALIREVLFQAVVPLRRRAWHRNAAEALIARPGSDPDEIAHHFEQAADERTAEWLIRAGNRAERAYAWTSAIDRFQRALSLLDESADHLRVRAWLLYRIGRLIRYMERHTALDTLDAAAEAARLAGETHVEHSARFHRCLVLCYCGEVRRAQTEMAEVIETMEVDQRAAENPVVEDEASRAESPSHPLLELVRTGTIGGTGPMVLKASGFWAPRATYLLGESIRGNYRQVNEQAPEVVAEIMARDPDARAGGRLPQEIGFARGMTSAGLGRPEDALRYFDASRDASEAIDHYLLACTAAAQALHLAILPYFTDRIAERQRYTRISREHGQRAMEATLSNQMTAGFARLGWEYLVSALWDKLPDDLDLAPTAFMVEDDREDAADVQAHLAYLKGNAAKAHEIIDEFIPDGIDAEPGDSCFVGICSLIRLAAQLHLDAENLDEARNWLETHDRWIEWSGSVLGRAEGTLGRARFYLLSDEIESAWDYTRQALIEASDPRQPLALIATHRFFGQLAAKADSQDEAWQHLRTSLEIARQCEAPYEQALTMLEMAELHAAAGDHDATGRLIAQVRAICKPLTAEPALARATDIERSLPVPVDKVVLTQREAEVLRLVARGMTDSEAADELFISPRTVGQHLRSIYNKLGVNNRTEAAHIAAEQELI